MKRSGRPPDREQHTVTDRVVGSPSAARGPAPHEARQRWGDTPCPAPQAIGLGSPIVVVTNRRLRVAVQLAPQHADYPAIRRAVAAAEDLGADAVFNWDHFFPLGKIRDGKHFECWTMLGAWAESTSRAEIGALVSCTSYRNPDLLADMARTVDHLSDGRLILGLGAGFREWEYTRYGYQFGTPGQRIQDLAAAVRRIEQRFASLNPAPTRKIPILMGGGGQKMLRLVARHADIWHTFADGDDLGEKSGVLDRHCLDLGRDPAEIERSTFVHGDPWEVGPGHRDRGITLFTVFTSGPDFDLAELRRWIAWRDSQNGERRG
jgi:probable F420-dependent oxidoreductase